jgi:hypothetical protein
MKMKYVLWSLLVLMSITVVGGMVFFWRQGPFLSQQILSLQAPARPEKSAGEPIRRNDPLLSCAPGDTACSARNEKIVANKLSGNAVSYAKHQCDGPRACPTPQPEVAEAAVRAIRIYAKDMRLELLRITGVNVTGNVFYCAKDDRCWSYSVKQQKVVGFLDGDPGSVSKIPLKK